MQEQSPNILKTKESSTQQHKTHNVWHLIKKMSSIQERRTIQFRTRGNKPSDRPRNYTDDRISGKGH